MGGVCTGCASFFAKTTVTNWRLSRYSKAVFTKQKANKAGQRMELHGGQLAAVGPQVAGTKR